MKLVKGTIVEKYFFHPSIHPFLGYYVKGYGKLEPSPVHVDGEAWNSVEFKPVQVHVGGSLIVFSGCNSVEMDNVQGSLDRSGTSTSRWWCGGGCYH